MRAASCVVALGLLCPALVAAPKREPPKVLLQILHCAKTDKFGLLDASLKKDGVIKASWRHSRHSDPGVGEEYFIVLPDSEKRRDVLVYTRNHKNGRIHFYLVNNGALSTKDGEVNVLDPLGGIWTHNHINQNVKRALRSGEYSIPARNLIGPQFANVGCHSYSDPE